MKKPLKACLSLLLASALTLSLAACGGGNSSSAPAGSTAPASTAPAGSTSEAAGSTAEPTGDQETITLYRTDDGNGAIEAVIEGFEAKFPQYKINWVEASNDTDVTRNQLNTAFAAGSSEYDIVSIDVVWAGDMAGAGYLEPLDSYIMDAGNTLADYNPGSLQSGTYKAKTYALPLYPDFGVLYFRKDIVSEEDAAKLISGDYTFDELIAMAETYKGQEGTTSGLNFQANQYEGLVCNANEWTANFTNVRGGLETMKKAIDSPATPDDITIYQESESANSFTNGESVFSRNWPYVWGLLGEEGAAVTQDQVDIAPMPEGSCIGGWLVAMNAFSEHKEGAWEFLNYMTSLEGQTIFCGKGGYVPGWNAATTDPAVTSANELLTKEGFKNALANTIARPSSDQYATMSNELQISMHKYLTGSQDLDATVTEVEALLGGGGGEAPATSEAASGDASEASSEATSEVSSAA